MKGILVLLMVAMVVWMVLGGLNSWEEFDRTNGLESENVQAVADPEPPEVKPVVYKETIPLVKVDLNEFEVDLKTRYLSNEGLRSLKNGDGKQAYGDPNGYRKWETSLGTFLVVPCCGRFSTDPKALNSGGMRQDMLQLPSGNWIEAWPGAFWVQEVREMDGQVFVICQHYIFRYEQSEKLTCVVAFDGVDGKWAPSVSLLSQGEDGFENTGGRYFEVHKSMDSDFGGLLEYTDGKWIFHQYTGSYTKWIEKVSVEDTDKIHLETFAWDGGKTHQIEFDRRTGEFKDL
jgi:hypothetical protein